MAQQTSIVRQIYAALVVSTAVAGVGGVWSRPTPLPAAAASSETSRPLDNSLPDWRWQGVGSCASTACHQGPGPRGSKRSEYTTWVNYDSHARAYTVLFDARSRRISANLHRREPAHENPLCLSCHAVQGRERRPAFLTDGVDCETCHGPAERWLAEHYLLGWRQLSSRQLAAAGMRPTKDLLVRGRLCADCHVGAPDREVNHDLIAAGHPRLNFEYGSYLAILPKHWSEREEKQRVADFEARVWALGQAASAQAALRLLARRARDRDRPWPEFAEYDCFACHHDLKVPSWRQARGYAQRTPGALPWSSWYTALLPEALRGLRGDREVLALLGAVKKEMQKPYPDRTRVADQAQAAADQMDELIAELQRAGFGPGYLQRLFREIEEEAPAHASWDGQTQTYLALAAMYHALSDLAPSYRQPRWRTDLRLMKERLRFPKGYDSPRDFDPKLPNALLERLQR